MLRRGLATSVESDYVLTGGNGGGPWQLRQLDTLSERGGNS